MTTKRASKKAEKPTQKSRLILPATDKGGCGKSFATTCIYKWLTMEGYKVLGFDPDSSTNTFTKYYPDDDITPIDVNSPSSIDNMINKLVAEGADISIVDGLGSEQTKTFSQWADETRIFDLMGQINLKITYSLNIEENSIIIDQVEEIMDRVGDKVDWIVIYSNKEHENPLPKEQSLWFNKESTKSGIRSKALDLGAKEIIIPRIHQDRRPWIFKNFMNVHDASLLTPDNPVPLFDKQRFGTEWNMMSEQFENAREFLTNE